MNEISPRQARYRAGKMLNARATLKLLNIGLEQDFHTLSRDQIDNLLAEADRVRYQRPRNANGSRARYFHAKLQREAKP